MWLEMNTAETIDRTGSRLVISRVRLVLARSNSLCGPAIDVSDSSRGVKSVSTGVSSAPETDRDWGVQGKGIGEMNTYIEVV